MLESDGSEKELVCNNLWRVEIEIVTIEISELNLNILIEEVLVHVNLALNAHSALRELTTNPATLQDRRAWTHSQSFLGHTAMVAKFVDPPRLSEVSRARSEALRAGLSIETNSPLLNRSIRNNVEHLDERLDAWIQAEGQRCLESCFATRKDYDFLNNGEIAAPRWFVKRVYLVDEDVFITQGRNGVEEMDFAVTVEALVELKTIAERFLSNDQAIVRIG
ncbi:hypothetical protein Q4578_06735 [Shimia thalassica]|uniref:hypothetical protein n=1 Tax=Shimia thalassica TaxID=1715693 RepID=UPI0026E191AA|nr:hypothetical protein [Shimia thalassica]MDO6521275.1 hypothetical protein [Shimia thalassica]